MISISQALRKIEIKIPALRKVKVLLMLETGRLKYSAMFPITIPVTITKAPVSAYEKKLIQVSRMRLLSFIV